MKGGGGGGGRGEYERGFSRGVVRLEVGAGGAGRCRGLVGLLQCRFCVWARGEKN